MPTTIAQKLKIKEGYSLLTVNAPPGFEQKLAPLPADVSIGERAKDWNQVHWFVMNRAQVEKEWPKVLKLVKPGVTCWIYYPKGSSKMQTDLTRDKGWETVLSHELQWLSLISFDETWSAFGLRQKTASDVKKEASPKERPIFDYVDPVAKTIRLPDDLAAAFKKNKEPQAFFNQLSFTNKKEWVEWIVTAKREETRATRVNETIDRLAKGWKNPANRG